MGSLTVDMLEGVEPELRKFLDDRGFHWDFLWSADGTLWPGLGGNATPAVSSTAPAAPKTEAAVGGLARGFLNKAPAKAPAMGKAIKKRPPGHYWSVPPSYFDFVVERPLCVSSWEGIEQAGEVQKTTRSGPCHFYRIPGFMKDAADKILKSCQESTAYQSVPDSVDKTPAFEYYPFRDGAWADREMRELLEPLIEQRLLPYLRERYDHPSCTVADVLVRRYLPGERRTHAVHFDGHAFITAVLGLSPVEDYQGGLYLQPEAGVASRTFLRIEPGDLVVHSFDLQHGVHTWKGCRYSLIFWVKDSRKSVVERTTPWYEPLAEQGDPDALFNLAQNYEYGTFGRPLDLEKAVELYEKSAASGHHFALNNLGLIYRRAHERGLKELGKERSLLEASVECLHRCADLGFAMAQKNLALAYANGQGVQRDDATAVRWMRKAAEQLEVEAAFMMGEFFRQGRGVPATPTDAALWYSRSAEAGFPIAQYALGMMLLEGAGEAKDLAKAEQWLSFAAAQGHPEAKNNVATLLAQRGEVDQAAALWADLAEGGEPNAQCNLGMCFLRGMGRPQDMKEARRWLVKASNQGHQLATQALLQLAT